MGRTNDRARERRGERERERESRRGLPKERWRDMERWHDMARAKQILKIIPRHSMYAIYAYIDPLAPPQCKHIWQSHGVSGIETIVNYQDPLLEMNAVPIHHLFSERRKDLYNMGSGWHRPLGRPCSEYQTESPPCH